MKNIKNIKINKYLFLFSIIIFGIGIGMYINNINNITNKESFIPIINNFYRPYERHVRNYTSTKWNNIICKINHFLKRKEII